MSSHATCSRSQPSARSRQSLVRSPDESPRCPRATVIFLGQNKCAARGARQAACARVRLRVRAQSVPGAARAASRRWPAAFESVRAFTILTTSYTPKARVNCRAVARTTPERGVCYVLTSVARRDRIVGLSNYIDAYIVIYRRLHHTGAHSGAHTPHRRFTVYLPLQSQALSPRLYSIGHFPCLRKRRLRRGGVIRRVSSERFVLFATDGAIHARSRRRERRTSPMLLNTLGAWDRCTRRTPP